MTVILHTTDVPMTPTDETTGSGKPVPVRPGARFWRPTP